MHNRPSENSTALYSLISAHRAELMGFAALWILIFHEWLAVLDKTTVFGWVEGGIKRLGYAGVDVFFFISGMGLYNSMRKSGTGGFYLRRLKKLAVPVLTLGLLKILFDGWPLLKVLSGITGWDFYLHSVYAFPWYIPAVISVYIVFPLYFRAFQASGRKGIFTLAFVAVWLVLAAGLRSYIREDLYLLINRLPVISLGVLLSWSGTAEKGRVFKGILSLCLILFAAGLVLSYFTNYREQYLLVPISDVFLPSMLLAVPACFILAVFFERCSTGVIKRFLAFFGGISLELYCLQEFMGSHIIPALSEHMPPLAVNLVFFAIVTLSAYLLSVLGKLIISGTWRRKPKAE